MNLVEIKDNKPFILHPGEFILGTTKETVSVPPTMIANVVLIIISLAM